MIPVNFAIMITCSANIHEIQRIILFTQTTGFPPASVLTNLRQILLAALVAVLTVLPGCELLRDEPTNMALRIIGSYASMSAEEYAGQSGELPMRERALFDYLRALREQGGKLSYNVDSVKRENPAHRRVVVVVNEKSLLGIKQERARFSVELSRDAENVWRVDSFLLVE